MYKTLVKYLVIFVSIYYLLYALYPRNSRNINLLISVLAVSTVYLLEEKLNVQSNRVSNEKEPKPNQAALNYLNKLIFGKGIKKDVNLNNYPLLRE